jgi:peptidoglycan/LPS O-acetylase OafA/YrhL
MGNISLRSVPASCPRKRASFTLVYSKTPVRLINRAPQLDGVRGVAILLVLVWHYFSCQVVSEPGSIFYYCTRAFSLTWSGVDLFFVLSGFLIAGILLDHRESSNYFRVFYLRRVCRIFPLYYLLLALFLSFSKTSLSTSPSFQWLLHDPLGLWSYVTFTQNILMGARGDFAPGWLGITWSLAVEEQFYLFMPLLIFLLPRRILLSVFMLGIVAAPILRCSSGGFHAFVDTPWRADSLLAGASLAVLVRWRPFMDAVQGHRRLLLSLFVALLVGVGVMSLRPVPFGAFNFSWLAGLYAVFILIAFADTEPLFGNVLRFPLLVWFGQLSYGMYMFHQAVIRVLHRVFSHGAQQLRTPSDVGIAILALFITLLLAMFSYHYFERPILRLGHRLQYSPKPRGEATLRGVSNAI